VTPEGDEFGGLGKQQTDGATFASFLRALVQQHRDAEQPFGESRQGHPLTDA
jgi:hypothetical protein